MVYFIIKIVIITSKDERKWCLSFMSFDLNTGTCIGNMIKLRLCCMELYSSTCISLWVLFLKDHHGGCNFGSV